MVKKTKTEIEPVITIDEHVPINKVIELLKSNILDILQYTDDKERTAEDWKINDFNVLLELLQNNGNIRRHYKPSETDTEAKERLYCGLGLQNVSGYIRSYLLHEDYTDIDICNCHPSILLELARKAGEDTPLLKDYCNNRETYLNKHGKDLKHKVLSQINDNHIYKTKDEELNKLYSEIYTTVLKLKGDDNICHKLYREERNLLDTMCKIANSMDIKVNVLIYDGLVIKNSDKTQEYLNKVNNAIHPYKVMIKKWQVPTITINNMTRFNYSDEITFNDFLNLSGRHYKTISHFYLNALPLLLKTFRLYNGNFITKNKQSSIHDTYTIHKKTSRDDFAVICNKKRVVLRTLIEEFRKLISIENITYNRYIDKNEFSLDSGFLCECDELPQDWQERIIPFKKHIYEVNANENERIAEGFYYWYANMLQTDNRSQLIMITTGSEGSGKSIVPTFIINKILGRKGLILATLTEITEKFNSAMAGKRFILVNEISNIDSKKKREDTDVLKNIVDCPYFNLEKKGVDKIIVKNFLEFMGCSNYDNCISQADGMQRRNFITRASDKYKDNAEYFNNLVSYFNEPKNIRSIYEYLMTYDLKKEPQLLHNLPITQTKINGIWNSTHPYIKACMILVITNNKNGKVKEKYTHTEIYDTCIKYNLKSDDKFNKSYLKQFLKTKVPFTNAQNRPYYTLTKETIKQKVELWAETEIFIKEFEADEEDICI